MEKDDKHYWTGIFLVLLRWRRFLFVNIFVAAVLMVGISLLMPNWYRGQAVILPPESRHQTLSLGGIVPDVVGAMELPLMASPSDVIASIARSRIVVDSVIRSLDLMKVLGTDIVDFAVRKFRRRLNVEVLESGMIEVSFIDKDPERAARVTNELVRILDEINRDVRITKAKNSRIFIESRLDDIEDSLAAAEDSLVAFRLRNRAVSLDEQTKAQINIVAQLEGDRLMAQTELEMMKKSLTPDHPEVKKLEDRVEGLRDIVSELEIGNGRSDTLGLLRQPLVDLPELALKLARLTRTVKIQEKLFELLTSQYEQARIEESKTTPTLSVLHYSAVPDLKYSPKRSNLVLLAAFLAAVLSLLWVWLIEYLLSVKQRDQDHFSKLRRLLTGLWLPRLSRRLNRILNE